MKVTPYELQRTLRLHGKVGGCHIFVRAKVELLEPMRVTVTKYRMELSRDGSLDAPEFRRDIDRWEITDWSRDPIPHEEMRPLPMELNCGEPVEGWAHFVTERSDQELDRSLVRLFVHTSKGTGSAEIPAGPEYWNVRIPAGLPACAVNASKQAGGGQERGRLPYGNTERKSSVSRTDGTGAPDRFRFPKTGTVVFLARRPGVFAVVLPNPPQPEHPQALRRER